ncbi:MAG: 3-phosphoshikimate 1-carboxyvinyltransferase [Candidatus Sumerlaeia bacterium]|nr:3-phosphoshikimate 1-carboxyvinyltransferase [Candidatus Sumerlaeia bacterium]
MIATVHPVTQPLTGTIAPPSSKNFTPRYVLAACLANGRSVVSRPAVQDDAVALVKCCRAMGADINALDAKGGVVDFEVVNAEVVDRLEIHGFGSTPKLRNPNEPLNPDNAGAVFRMLLAISALLPWVSWVTDHHDSLGKRPNQDLLDALEQLGVVYQAKGSDGCLPMSLEGGLDRIQAHIRAEKSRLELGEDDPFPITVAGGVSSQYTSALLFLAPLLGVDVEIHVTGRLRSIPLIETTRGVLSAAGVGVESNSERSIHLVRRGQAYAPRRWDTNGDWPGSSAILAAAVAVPGSNIRLSRLFQDDQGEKECVPFYERMGATVRHEVIPGEGELLDFSIPTDKPLEGRAANGDLCTDAVLAMMAGALFARGESRFVQIKNLQFKECDRVREPIAELRKIYATAKPDPEGGTVLPPEKGVWYEPEDDPDIIHVNGVPQGFIGGIDVDGRGDHRVIMMLSIVALRCEKGLRIHGAEHVKKSFPGWFRTLKQMGVKVEFSEN